MNSSREVNYWPGFVDALSNVVLTLVFVLIVFVFALVVAADKIEKKMQEVVTSEKVQKEQQFQLETALSELDQARAEDAARPTQNPTATQAAVNEQGATRFNKSDSNQEVEINDEGGSVLILFAPNAISVSEGTAKIIHDYIDAYRIKTNNAHARFIIESSEDPTAPSPLMSRETQLGRMLNVRNVLLSNKINAPDMSVHNIAPIQKKGSYNWVRVHVEK